MSELTKNQLKTDNTNSFPNNNTGYITPSILRDFNINMIDSLVDEVSYGVESASFQSQIDALESWSSSLDATYVTDSVFNAYTASETVESASFNARINALDPSGSAAAILALEQATGSLNAYTASNDVKWSTLGSKTGSYATTGSNTFNGNQNIVGALTASGLNYPSADNGAESFIQTDGAGNLSLQYVKTMYQNIRNMETSSIVKGTPLYASGSTGDNVDVYIADAGNPLRMPATLIAGDTTLSAGATGKGIIFGHIEGVDTSAYTAGTEVFVGVGGGWTSTRPTGSSTPIQPLGVVTRQGSNGMGIVMTETPYDLPNIATNNIWIGNGSNQPVTRSLSNLGLALTGSNNSFSGTQTFNNVEVNGTASVAFLNVTYQSSSVIFSSGSNILGDASGDTQTLWGTVKLPTGPLDVTGSINSTGNVSVAAGAYSAVTVTADVVTDPTNVFSSVGVQTPNGANLSLALNSYSPQYGSTPTPTLIGYYNNSQGSDTALGFPSNGQMDVWKKSNFKYGVDVTGSQLSLNNNGGLALKVYSGSVEVTSPQGTGHFYSNLPITSSGLRINGTALMNDLIISGVFSGNSSLQVLGNASVTGSTTFGSNFNTDTHIISGAVSIQGQLNANGTNVINAINNLTSVTASYATTGSNTFSGNQTINANLVANKVSAYNFDSLFLGSQMGGTTANGTFFGYGSTSYEHIIGAYAGGFDNELKITANSTGVLFGDFNGSSYPTWLKLNPNSGTNPAPQFVRGLGISGSLLVSGSTQLTGSVNANVGALSISSNTASLNLNNGNFFTLQLVSGSDTHINPSNIKPGQTINIRLNTTGSGTVSFPSSVKQVSGSAYVPTTATGVDVITLVSFDSSTLYLASVKNLV